MNNHHFIIGLSLLATLVSCTIPTTSDFQSPNRPLGEDEFVAIWRFPSKASPNEIMDTTQAHADAMYRYLNPLFQQLIPRIFADARTSKLVIHKKKNIGQMEDEPITDLPAAMAAQYQADWQHLEPFMGAFHIVQRRQDKEKGFLAKELELELVAQDPKKELPEKFFGSVRFSDLVELEYQVELEGKIYDLRDYLVNCIPYAYPIHYRTTEFANGLVSLEQAFATKKIVLDGKWNDLEWLGTSPNLSEFVFKPQKPEILQSLAGTYLLSPESKGWLAEGDGEQTEALTAEITVEEDYLIISWPHKPPYFAKGIFPNTATSFFTGDGTEVHFETVEDELRFEFTDHDQTHLIGIRKMKE